MRLLKGKEMDEKDIQDIFADETEKLVSCIRNDLTYSESIQALYAKLIWAYYEGLNDGSGEHHEITIKR
jgi:hypothetical protein